MKKLVWEYGRIIVPPGLISKLVAFLDHERARETCSEEEMPFCNACYILHLISCSAWVPTVKQNSWVDTMTEVCDLKQQIIGSPCSNNDSLFVNIIITLSFPYFFPTFCFSLCFCTVITFQIVPVDGGKKGDKEKHLISRIQSECMPLCPMTTFRLYLYVFNLCAKDIVLYL